MEKHPARLQIAPMLAVTDKHFRRFFRGITKEAELWTEMVVDSTVLHAPELGGCLDFDPVEHPIVCQLGGSDPELIARAAEVVSQWGYNEINLNCGCPSVRVAGPRKCFGAALMRDPERVRRIVYETKRRVPDIPVSVKTRIGVDELDKIESLTNFIDTVSSGGCSRFIIHARKAWLNGINPSRNRSLPPLQYHKVYQIALAFPHLSISINGGVSSLKQAADLLNGSWVPSKPHLTSEPLDSSSELNGLIPPNETLTASKNTILIDEETEGLFLEESDSLISRSPSCSDSSERTLSSVNEWFRELEGIADLADEAPIPINRRPPRTKVKEKEAFRDICRTNPFNPVVDYNDALQVMKRVRSQKNFEILDGVMLGRAAMNDPCMFACVDSKFYGARSDPFTARSPRSIIENYVDYLNDTEAEIQEMKSIFILVKPLLGVLNGRPGSRLFRHSIDRAVREYSKHQPASEIILDVIREIEDVQPGVFDIATGALTVVTDEIY